MECRPYLLRIGYKWLNLSCHGKKYIIFILVRYLRLVSRDDPGVTNIESSVSIYGDIQLTHLKPAFRLATHSGVV